MKVYQYAKKYGMTNDEVKEKYDLASHLSVVPEAEEEVAQEAPKKKTKEDDPELLKEVQALRTGIWDKTIPFLQAVSDNQDKLPNEYKRVQKYIDRYIK